MSPANRRKKQIAKWNDLLRRRAPICLGTYGRTVCTAGIASLEPETQADLLEAVRRFDGFNEENDPYGEHDFGSIQLPTVKLFWKIDYYADPSCIGGSEDPSDPEKTYRVLTIMLAEEY